MSLRSFVAFLLLANYLLIAGIGGIMQPYERQSLFIVQTTYEGQSYQECRYLRMDGLENFLIESLSVREQKDQRPLGHSILIEINGVDIHCLFYTVAQASTPDLQFHSSAKIHYFPSSVSEGVDRTFSPPPWVA
ncbi:hypothetical protein [Runella sp.]|uniref:hypothetical protein n=1 Tax=Runella sp. TaxID=1960881 RepID=UPI003D0C87AF